MNINSSSILRNASDRYNANTFLYELDDDVDNSLSLIIYNIIHNTEYRDYLENRYCIVESSKYTEEMLQYYSTNTEYVQKYLGDKYRMKFTILNSEYILRLRIEW